MKVVVKNISKLNIGLSFKMLYIGQETIVEESIVTEADKRMEKKGNITIKPARDESQKLPVQEPAQGKDEEKVEASSEEEVVESNQPSEGPGEESSDEQGPAEEVIESNYPVDKPADAQAEEPADEPVEPLDNKEPADEADDRVVYSHEELNEMSRNQLREIAEPLGVSGRSRDDLMDGILGAQ